MRLLVIDNYDSFVYTLVGYLEQLGAETTVLRNDAVSEAELPGLLAEFDAVLVSPGPGNPGEAGVSIPLIRLAAQESKPLLGVCLGHQAIAEAYGATVTHAEELMHGKTSRVQHDGDDFYAGVPAEFQATRYHSLAVVRDTVPEELEVTASTASGIIMALRHKTAPLFGVQYHPESVMTEYGYRQLGNWLELAGLAGVAERAAGLSPLIAR
ncbi:MAG: aminodeoxychorismate/anthranilate synthase component II [Microbacteriaceae bacterium]|nr:aminodeoxychorismate/anthranilate synthase component II [Microbacteriaceae bacterium]